MSHTQSPSSREEIADGELTGDLQRQVTEQLANIILHQHDAYDQEIVL